MAIIIGQAGEIRQLPANEKYQDKGNGEAGLTSFSIEGLGFLVKPADVERLGLGGMAGQMVRAVVSVQWRKGSKPIHWLSDCRAAVVS